MIVQELIMVSITIAHLVARLRALWLANLLCPEGASFTFRLSCTECLGRWNRSLRTATVIPFSLRTLLCPTMTSQRPFPCLDQECQPLTYPRVDESSFLSEPSTVHLIAMAIIACNV